MVTLISPCRDAFDEARAFRATSPLPSGHYKLEEAQEQLHHMRQTVTLFAVGVRSAGHGRSVGQAGFCNTYDRGPYFERMPYIIAGLLGRKILPAIAALGGDGVPADKVELLMQRSEQQTDVILANADRVHGFLKAGIKTEYDEMKVDGSHLLSLLCDVEELVEAALDSCNAS